MSAFRKLAARYASLGVVVSDTAKAVAADLKTELEQGFAKGQDASGGAWPNLATGAASHLRKSGKYEASLQVVALTSIGQSIVEMTTGPAGNLHAKDSFGRGRRFQPARPLMPIAGQDLPPKWKGIIEKNYADSMREALK